MKLLVNYAVWLAAFGVALTGILLRAQWGHTALWVVIGITAAQTVRRLT